MALMDLLVHLSLREGIACGRCLPKRWPVASQPSPSTSMERAKCASMAKRKGCACAQVT